jgi:hypothetical protein
MLLIQTETDLVAAFRPRDRAQVALPPGTRLPLLVRDYRAWLDPQGFRTFLVLAEPGGRRPMGIVFEREARGGAPVSQLCDWCHCSGSSQDIGLLTTSATSKRRVGVNVCLDLTCSDKLEDLARLTGRNQRDLAAGLASRMLRFAREGLGMDFAAVTLGAPASAGQP